ncbi:MAG TPA: JAB domain-containing protein [Bacteroidales bacterium]|nr:JAB domain-containing protein [Bacteroidales bacterium]
MKNTQSTQQTFDFLHVAEVTLTYVTKVKPSERLSVKCSRDAHKIFFDSWDHSTIEHKESVKMLLLNRANKVLGITTLSEGGISGSLMDVRIIYQFALKGNASGIIIAHNHPSGNSNPSESDLKITKKIKEAGNLLDIQLLDHIIVTPEKDIYRSFADEGQL